MKPRINHFGHSLIEVLIASVIMLIVLMSLVSMQNSQAKENKALTEKIASLDFERVLSNSLARPTICNSLLLPANISSGSLTFDASAVSPTTPHIINLIQIAGTSVGSQVSPMSTSLVAQQIQIQIVSKTTAFLTVSFDSSKLVREIHNPKLQFYFESTGPLNATTITECGGSATRLVVNLDVLKDYVYPLGGLWNGQCVGANGLMSNSNLAFAFNSACSRYCSTGCSSTMNCSGGILPGSGYSGGLMTECNQSILEAECTCLY